MMGLALHHQKQEVLRRNKMWTKKDFPTIPGFESLGDDVQAKRWVDFRLERLLDLNDPLWEFHSSLKTREDVCNFVILQFGYPLKYGQPTDKHYNNWFGGLCCHTITQDYWQTATETLRTLRLNQRTGTNGYGDCEDVSCLLVAMFLAKSWKAYECLGYVLSKEGQILGGHGFPIIGLADGSWRLVEATLSQPLASLESYPEADPDGNDLQVGDLTYHAIAKLNKEEYAEWDEDQLMGKYVNLGIKGKETRAKHEAISANWGIKTKPMQKLGLLAKLRWKE
jgi:hypothetical protein